MTGIPKDFAEGILAGQLIPQFGLPLILIGYCVAIVVVATAGPSLRPA
ncbi:MAG TPA: hypothetical protein VN880_14625 [Solirubrobacteraceae bacterium]|nr:hypothetical protein [Solirubrobacteraceae bacterium]